MANLPTIPTTGKLTTTIAALAYPMRPACALRAEELAKQLKRDFDITDELSVCTAIDLFSSSDEGLALRSYSIFRCCTQLYILYACAELGLIDLEIYTPAIADILHTILRQNIASWQDYAQQFLAGQQQVGTYTDDQCKETAQRLTTLLHADEGLWQKLSWQDVTAISQNAAKAPA